MFINVDMVGAGLAVQHAGRLSGATASSGWMHSVVDVFTTRTHTQVNGFQEVIALDAGEGRSCLIDRVDARYGLSYELVVPA